MDPNEFDKLQSSLYPSFQKMNAQPMMIGVAIGLFILLMVIFYKIRHQLFQRTCYNFIFFKYLQQPILRF